MNSTWSSKRRNNCNDGGEVAPQAKIDTRLDRTKRGFALYRSSRTRLYRDRICRSGGK